MAYLDKKQLDEKKAANQLLLKSLQTYYPLAFSGYKILKIGIDLDILKDKKIQINRSKLRDFLCWYTKNKLYIRNHVIGAKRHDLQGDAHGEVTKEQYNKLIKFREGFKRKPDFQQSFSSIGEG